jgi:hypothetical protein
LVRSSMSVQAPFRRRRRAGSTRLAKSRLGRGGSGSACLPQPGPAWCSLEKFGKECCCSAFLAFFVFKKLHFGFLSRPRHGRAFCCGGVVRLGVAHTVLRRGRRGAGGLSRARRSAWRAWFFARRSAARQQPRLRPSIPGGARRHSVHLRALF